MAVKRRFGWPPKVKWAIVINNNSCKWTSSSGITTTWSASPICLKIKPLACLSLYFISYSKMLYEFLIRSYGMIWVESLGTWYRFLIAFKSNGKETRWFSTVHHVNYFEYQLLINLLRPFHSDSNPLLTILVLQYIPHSF